MAVNTLHELTEEYAYMLEVLSDTEADEQTIIDTIEASGLDEAFSEKAVNYAIVIQELEGLSERIKVEESRLASRRKTCESNVKRLKNRLEESMRIIGKNKLKTDLFSFSIQKNPPSVVIDENIENIPAEYLIKQDPKIDRTKIKNDLKAGKDLEGIAHLEQTESLRIR